MSEQTDLAMRLTLQMPFDAALRRVKEALKTQGFGVMSEIDVREAMQQKLGIDFRRYIILGRATRLWPIAPLTSTWTPASSFPATSSSTRTAALSRYPSPTRWR